MPGPPTPGRVSIAPRTPHPGDANLDGVTDVRDFNVWNANKFTSGTDRASGDFTGDGHTDVRDFNVWNAHKFTSAPAPASVDAALTEPLSPGPTVSNVEVRGIALLYDFEPVSSSRPTSNDASHVEAAVDKLLATYWPS